MLVAMDIRPMQGPAAGIGNYAGELARRFARDGRGHRFVFYARAGAGDVALDGAAEVVFLDAPGALWHAAAVADAWRRGVALYHSTHSLLVPALGPLPTVVTIHDASAVLFPETHDLRVRASYRLLRLAARRARLVLTVSASARRDLEAVGIPGERVRAVYNGVDDALARPGDGDLDAALARRGLPRGYVLFVGTVEPRKNLERLAAACVRAGLPLVVAGRLGWRAAPSVAALGAANARMLGYVPRRELPALLAGAAVFAYPSLNEGFGLPLLEAMACGTPVVTSRGGATEEIAGDAARLVDPTDVAALAAALREVALDEGVAAGLRERGARRVNAFSWERCADETAVVFAEAAAAR